LGSSSGPMADRSHKWLIADSSAFYTFSSPLRIIFEKKCTGFWYFPLESMHLLYQKTAKNAVAIGFVNYSVDIN
ncbi:MAG: hypothetical protein KBE32_05505, partial [Leptotrichiaceae bacterium]|nr:hypothetical protein [Leptotrichiaceae bacterium]